jgi:hypothetical protein
LRNAYLIQQAISLPLWKRGIEGDFLEKYSLINLPFPLFAKEG